MGLALLLCLRLLSAVPAAAETIDPEALRGRISDLLSGGGLRGAVHAGSAVFYYRRDGTRERDRLYVRDAPDKPARLLLDPEALAPGKAAPVESFFPSLNGALIAYVVRHEDRCRIHAREVDSGLDWPDAVPAPCSASVAWLKDRSGFYYSAGASIFLHQAGTDPLRDEKIVSTRLEDGLRLNVQVSSNGRYLLLYAEKDGVNAELLLHDTQAKNAPFRLLSKAGQAFSRVIMKDESLYVLTSEAPGQSKAMRLDMLKPYKVFGMVLPENLSNSKSWNILAREQAGWRFDDMALAGPYVAVKIVERGSARVQLYDRKGEAVRELPLPRPGAVESLASSAYSSWISLIQEIPGKGSRLMGYHVETSSLAMVEAMPSKTPKFTLQERRYMDQAGNAGTLFLASHGRIRRNKRNDIWLTVGDEISFPASLPIWLENEGLFALAIPEGSRGSAKDAIKAIRWLTAEEYAVPQGIYHLTPVFAPPDTLTEKVDGQLLLIQKVLTRKQRRP